jgi:hypothetical protein
VPPIGGIGLLYSFGSETPFSIVWVIAARLPSPHSHLPLVRSGPCAEPFAFDPWQPAQVAPPSWPRKIRAPNFNSSRVAPSGTASAATAASSPACGLRPSGGYTFDAAGGLARGAGAGSMPVVVVLP